MIDGRGRSSELDLSEKASASQKIFSKKGLLQCGWRFQYAAVFPAVERRPRNPLGPRTAGKTAFATEKLTEIQTLARYLRGDAQAAAAVQASQALWQKPPLGYHQPTRDRVAALQESDFVREVPYAERERLQRERLQLPPLPTTTIGSFPQTEDLRALRKAFREGKISKAEYDTRIREKIAEVIRFQEALGLDVLVHGEFERSDMVEFFAEKLEGFAITNQGWVLSYGSRVYRAPIIYGDVWRPAPMTVEEITLRAVPDEKARQGYAHRPSNDSQLELCAAAHAS